jgi:hypothetical protein
LGEPPLPDGEGEGAVEGDDERTPGGPVLELLQEHEEQGLEPLVLIKPAVPGVPVDLLVADMEGDGPDQRGEGRRAGHGARQPDGARVDAELRRGEAEQILPALQESRRKLNGLPPPAQGRA